MPRLIVVSGADVGREYSFETSVVAGRDKSADLQVRSPSVSRQHARLEARGSAWFLVDLGSSNGSFVGGERVSESELSDGQFVRLGEVELRFRLTAASAPPPPQVGTPLATNPAPVPPALAGEIELEGDWSAVPLPSSPAATPARSAPSSAPSRPGVERGEQRVSAARQEVLRAASAQAVERGTTSGGRILQYHKHSGRPGFFGADFAQHSTFVRATVVMLLLALGLGLAFAAFQLTRSLREQREVVVPEEP